MKSRWVAVLIYCGTVLLAPKASDAAEKLNGVVTDTNHKPLKAARVIAVPEQQRYWLPEEIEPLAKATANAQGEFSISVPTTGPVVLVAWSKDYRMAKFPVKPDTANKKTIGLALQQGYTFSGTVTDAATGKPIEGASVGPLSAGLDTPPQQAMRVVQQWTSTNAKGQFSLEGLATDIDHKFIVQSPGYVIANVELYQGQETVAVKLDKGGSTVSGEVFARNKPRTAFADVLIRANGNGFDVVTRTDAQSRFRIEGLPGGTFSVEPIMLSGNRSATVEVVEMPDDHNTSLSLEVSSGYQLKGTAIDLETSAPATGVTIGMADYWTSSTTDGSFSLGPFYEAQQISLQVPEEAGWQLAEQITGNEYDAADGFNDVEGMVVKVRRQRQLDVTIGDFQLTTSPVTLTVLDAGGQAVRHRATSSTVSVPVYQAGSYVIYAASVSLASEVRTLSVGLEKSIPVSLTLQAGADVSGKLVVTNTDETTRAQTLKLALRTATGTGAGPDLFLGTSPRRDGSFQLATMPTGNFLLTVSNKSGSHQTTRAVTLTSGRNDLGEITWQAGNRLTGEVRSGLDMAIPYARIGLLLPGGQVLHSETDDEGRFQFDDIYADSLADVIVEAGSYALYREQNVPLPQADKKIVMQALGKLNIRVEAPAGTRWDVHLVRMSRWASGTYAEQIVGNSMQTHEVMGSETLEVGLGESGIFRAIAVSKATREIRVSPAFKWAGEAAKGHSLVLSNGGRGRITGTVAGAEDSVEVTVINTAIPEQLDREKAEQTVPVSNGRFQVTELPAGNYMVLGQGETYSGFVLNVELAAGESATANLEPVQPATAEGVVQLAGEPLVRASIKLLSETDSSVAPQTATTDDNGQFVFAGLLPDTYSITATYQAETGELSTRKSLTVKPGELAPVLTLDLTPPKPVHFTVDPTMGIAANIDVNLMNKQTRQVTKALWVDGALEAEAVPGEYEVWLGDSVGGVAIVLEDGTGRISKN